MNPAPRPDTDCMKKTIIITVDVDASELEPDLTAAAVGEALSDAGIVGTSHTVEDDSVYACLEDGIGDLWCETTLAEQLVQPATVPNMADLSRIPLMQLANVLGARGISVELYHAATRMADAANLAPDPTKLMSVPKPAPTCTFPGCGAPAGTVPTLCDPCARATL